MLLPPLSAQALAIARSCQCQVYLAFKPGCPDSRCNRRSVQACLLQSIKNKKKEVKCVRISKKNDSKGKVKDSEEMSVLSCVLLYLPSPLCICLLCFLSHSLSLSVKLAIAGDNSFACESTTAWPTGYKNRTMAGLSQK